MQTVGSTIETNIGCNRSIAEALIERRAVGQLVNEAALFRGNQKGRASIGHGRLV